ncbi:MAG: PDZ domain-containing protein [Myxococcota bacterium]|nr:PDZ domain-containing protein [Myxococcota bacterium]
MSSATYRVRVLPESHVLEVQLSLSGLPPGPIRLQVPTWVPGAYGFMKYGRDLYEMEARNAAGPLGIAREGWQGFWVDGASGEAEIRYRAYAYDPAWGELTGLVDHEHAVLIGPRYLQAVDHHGPVRVQYQLPAGWAFHHPAGAREVEPFTYEYPRFSLFTDTPVVAGGFTQRTRDCTGTPFHFLFLDQTLGFDTQVDRFIDAVMKVAEACREIFGSFPFPHYSFVFTFNPHAGWGLEHATSTMIALGPDALIDPDEFSRGVRVSAHELFHAWNVCRLKPAPFMRPDFTHGSFTDGLWVAEGFTRYYEFLLLVRSGAITPETFLSNVVNYYRQLSSMPAYARVPVRDSSITTFLNHNKYPGSTSNTIDYYDHGMLVAFDLDAHLRCAPSPTSLDHEFAAFYEAFVGKADGFTHQDLVGFFGARTPGTEALIRREVEQAGTLSVPQTLERLGFQLSDAEQPRLGLVLKQGGAGVENVLDGWAASKTGLAPGDELLRVNGFPFSPKALKWAIGAGTQVALEVRRGHRTLTFQATPEPRTQPARLHWRGSAAQLELLRSWFGQPELTFTDGQELSLAAYDNFHGVQQVL